MPRNRSSDLEMNFDGLTDSVTNLVGALILLVVLVIGVTKEAVSQEDRTRKQKQPPKKAAGEKSIRPLQDRVNQLQAQIGQVDKQTGQIKTDLQQLQNQVDSLLDKVRKVQTPKPKTVPPKKVTVQKVPFRPPFERLSFKQTNFAFICENKRISFFDLASYNKEAESGIKAKTLKKDDVLRLATGDFDVKVTNVVWLNTKKFGRAPVPFGAELIRKSGHEGESMEAILSPASQFQQKLKAAEPAKDIIQFSVYPDSYAAFRSARKMAWDRKFDLGWNPQLAGDPIRVGVGAASSQ